MERENNAQNDIEYKKEAISRHDTFESCHKCPSENGLDKMSPNFAPQKKCPLDFVLGKMSFEVNVLDKNVL